MRLRQYVLLGFLCLRIDKFSCRIFAYQICIESFLENRFHHSPTVIDHSEGEAPFRQPVEKYLAVEFLEFAKCFVADFPCRIRQQCRRSSARTTACAVSRVLRPSHPDAVCARYASAIRVCDALYTSLLHGKVCSDKGLNIFRTKT